MIKKADITVFCIIIVLCIIFAVFFFNTGGKNVVIKKQNQTVCTLPLNEDAVYELEDNTVVIKDGKVFMQSAGCPDQLCVKHNAISNSSESIVCLPNRVIIEVK